MSRIFQWIAIGFLITCSATACKKDPYRDVPDVSSMPAERSKTTGVISNTEPEVRQPQPQPSEHSPIPVARRDSSGNLDATDLMLQKPLEVRSLPAVSLAQTNKKTGDKKKEQDSLSFGVGGLQMDSSMQQMFNRPSGSLLGDGSLTLSPDPPSTSGETKEPTTPSSPRESKQGSTSRPTSQPVDSDEHDDDENDKGSDADSSTTKPAAATTRPSVATTRPSSEDGSSPSNPAVPFASSTRLGAAGTPLLQDEPTEQVVIPDVLARINDEPVDRWSFLQLLQEIEKLWQWQQGIPPTPAVMTELRKQALKRSIDHILIHQKAQQDGTQISPAEEAEGIKLFFSQFPKRTTLEEYLRSSGLSREQFLERLRRQLVVRKYMMTLARQIPFTSQQIREYYNKHMNDASVRARQIVISVTPGKEAEAETKARNILALARQPNANFVMLVQQFSDDPAKSLGGDLGVLKRGDALPAMEEVLFSLQKGQVGGPIKTDDSYHIVQVVERTMPKPLAQVQMQIVEQLQMKKLESILLKQVEELRSEAQIKIYVSWGKEP